MSVAWSIRGPRRLAATNCAALLLALAPSARAATWIPGASALAQRSGHALAYDAARGRVVLYGGTCAETWLHDGSSWVRGPEPPAALGVRRFHAMAYDTARGVTVLFGGASGASVKNDTWDLGAGWTAGPAAPAGLSPRQLHAMAYDAGAAATVLFGGLDDTVTRRNDTWLYDGTAWTPGPAAPPALTARQGHAMSFAGASGTVLFGGFGCAGAPCNDTWLFNGSSWAPGPAAPAGLAPRQSHALAYDAVRDDVVLFGGLDFLGTLRNDTWVLSGVAWSSGPAAPAGLAPRQLHAAAFDAGRGQVVLFGGAAAAGTLNDTWRFDGSAWSGGPPAIPSARIGHSTAYDAARRRVVLFGGREGGGSLKNDTWEYDGASWVQGPPAPAGLAPRQIHATSYGAALGGVVVFGGNDGASRRNDLWKYDGTAWTPGPAAPLPLTPREGAAMAFVEGLDRLVLFGGLDATGTLRNDTWEFDGLIWTQGPPPPPGLAPRQLHAAAYDSGRGQIIVFGGLGASGVMNDTWEYLLGWTQGAPAPAGLAPRQQHALAYDRVRGRTVLYGGGDASGSFGDTWELDGSQWATGGVVPAELTPRLAHAAAYDVQRGRVVMFGGSLGGCFFAETWEYGTENVLAGAGLGPPNPNRVRVLTADGQGTVVDFSAYNANAWGCNVAEAELDGSSFREILTGPGPGATLGPQVRGFRKDATVISKVNFFAYGTLKYGANVASLGTDADAYGEIVTGAGPGAVFGPHVRGFNFDNAAVSAISKVNFFAYGTLKYGANVSGGDVERDGFEEIVTGAGPGAVFGPHVRGFNVDGGTAAAIAKLNFNAHATTEYGVNVAGGDVDADGFAEIASAPGPGPANVNQFLGFDYDGGPIAPLPGFDLTLAPTYGGRVGLGDVGFGSPDDLIAGNGPNPLEDSRVFRYGYTGSALVPMPSPYEAFPGLKYGVNATAGEFGY